MSHIVEARTKIQNPDAALLRQALEIIADAHEGGHVENHMLDFGGRQQQVSTGLAVFTGQVHRGIGIEITSEGMLSFKGDPWRVQEEFTLLGVPTFFPPKIPAKKWSSTKRIRA